MTEVEDVVVILVEKVVVELSVDAEMIEGVEVTGMAESVVEPKAEVVIDDLVGFVKAVPATKVEKEVLFIEVEGF